MGEEETNNNTNSSNGSRNKTAFEVLGLEFLIIAFVVMLIFGFLNYLSIFPLYKMSPKLFGWLPTIAKSSAPKNITDNSHPKPTPFTATKVTIFTCPVASMYCNSGKSVSFQNNPSLLYKVPEGNITKTLSFYVLESKPLKVDTLTGFSQTFIYNNYCYTASYLYPTDAKLETIKEVPFGPNVPLATLGKLSYKNGDNEGNVLIQLQKRKIDKPLRAKHEVESCKLLTKEKQEYGSYEALKTNFFN